MKLSVFVMTLLFCLLAFSIVQVQPAKADVPNVLSVAPRNVGSVAWVDITVRHGGFISAGHYVSNIQLEVNGTTQNLSQSPQSTETFTVSYNLGSSSNNYRVRARVLCNLHGYSGWSTIVVIPEFSLIAAAMFLILVTVGVVVAKKALSGHTKAAKK